MSEQEMKIGFRAAISSQSSYLNDSREWWEPDQLRDDDVRPIDVLIDQLAAIVHVRIQDIAKRHDKREEALMDTIAYLEKDRDRWKDKVNRAVRGLKNIGRFHYTDDCEDPHTLDCCLWGRVAHVFGLGSTSSIELCRECGQDPDYHEPNQDSDPDLT